MAITGFEIDFLPVDFQHPEKGKTSGDAILFRYKEDEEYRVILIDGGWANTSDTILEHMRNYYYPELGSGEKMRIDHIICSHPDSDHVGGAGAEGLKKIIEKCDVGTLWLNRLLNGTFQSIPPRESRIDFFSDRDRATEDVIEQPDDYYPSEPWFNYISDADYFSDTNKENIKCLITAAENKIEVAQPLQDKKIGPFIVASPSEEFYDKLAFATAPPNHWRNTSKRKGAEKLKGDPITSVCNESSTVLFGKLMGKQFLLTADAGIQALSRAYDYLKEEHDFQPGDLDLIQIPHHGSDNSVNDTTLNNLLGEKINENRGKAIVSVAKGAKSPPAPSVIDAFEARGYSCESTSGDLMRFKYGDMPE